jgi:hypothetical protein
MRAWVALFLLLPGCFGLPDPARPAISDDRGDAPARYDLLEVRAVELNGSLAVRLQVADFSQGLPLAEVRIGLTAGERFVRLVPDPNRTSAPQVRAEEGRWEDARRSDVSPSCWAPNLPTRAGNPNEPWYIVLELLHNRTGLQDGGNLNTVWAATSDINGTQQDVVQGRLDLRVIGGANPYDTCPLARERHRVF